ncbi:hypothetical protein, partial [Noviherbaspirillum sp.]|uniref:hypothetical protein n=1 Tax=Noviherbaspirillum sp. TaxID=1926288 RepID=UPI0025FB600B
MAISRENSLGWVFSTGGGDSALEGRPELACMRQIAHELLTTIHQFVPEFSQHAQRLRLDRAKPRSEPVVGQARVIDLSVSGNTFLNVAGCRGFQQWKAGW